MKQMKKGVVAAAAVLTALTLSACGSDPAPESNTEQTVETPTENTQSTEQVQLGTVVDVASQAGSFATLLAALNAADLVTTLSSEGPFTVFAPTDEAFAALPAGVLDALLLPENKETLVQILTYHVVPGKVMSSMVMDGEVPTVEGRSVTLSTANGVTVNNANVVTTDIDASNGVIHVIDAVILPPGLDLSKLG
jgi:uncharacterized surface protein with fasciclin (FAS1) repeats